MGMTSSDPSLTVEAEETTCHDNDHDRSGISKLRVYTDDPAIARQLALRLKRRQLAPSDLLCRRNDDDDGGDSDSTSNGSCGDCGARYGRRPLQITHVVSCCLNNNVKDDHHHEVRWARAAPPKFQRIVNADDVEVRRADTRFVYVENVEGWAVQLEFGSDINNNIGDAEESKSTHALLMERMRHCLLSVLDGDTAPLIHVHAMNQHHDVANNKSAASPPSNHHNSITCSDIQDDLHQSFQEGIRRSLSKYDSSSFGMELFMKSDSSMAAKKKSKQESNHQKAVYTNFHVGMKYHDDAAALVNDMQGAAMRVDIRLPETFTSLFVDSSQEQDCHNNYSTIYAIVTMNKLFLDYADILLPKRIRSSTHSKTGNDTQTVPTIQPGLPSRSECTSTTSHVHIPGLHLLPNYITTSEEQVLLSVLTGPDAPWAPKQYTPSGGVIKRRVQHYGYVFDYESGDVLRRDCENNDGTACNDYGNRCPPLPAVDLDVVEDVEEWIRQMVNERRGWEVLAGVIERTRRMDFTKYNRVTKDEKASSLNNDSVGVPAECNNDGATAAVRKDTDFMDTPQPLPQSHPTRDANTYPNINQLTINEYTPGQGIGSHVDTETAFADGLLIITLQSGIVMEFRKVTDHGDNTKKLVYLPQRSLILLSRDARYKWEHMIVSRTTDTVDGVVIPRNVRVSLTLRTALSAPRNGEEAAPLPGYKSTHFPPYLGQPADTDLIKDHSQASTITRSDLITPTTESKHVHAVYDAIATQWHHTRGRRGVLWPGATQFLENLPPGSIVADVGCGDGKYFSAILGANSYVIGTDISEALLRTASSVEKSGSTKRGAKAVEGPQYQRLHNDKSAMSLNPAVAVADCIHLPIKSGSCDAAICIAVMHHLSTDGRRLRCLSELARVVRVGGLINVQAWALEQEEDSKRKFHGADVLVPFNAQPKYLQSSDSKSDKVMNNGTNGKGVAQMLSESYDGADFDSKKNLVIFQRYCHMYRRGELEDLVAQIPTLQLMESAYEKGNHVVLLKVCGDVSFPVSAQEGRREMWSQNRSDARYKA